MSQETYKPVIYSTFLLHVLERLRILKCPYYPLIWCFPDSSIGKEQCKRPWFNSLIGKVRWRRDRLPTPYGSAGKEFIFNEGDLGLIPGLGRSPGEGKGYPLQYSGLENSMDLYSPWGHKESDTTEQLSFFFFLASLVAQMVKLLPVMPGFDPWVWKIPWRRERLPTLVFWPGEFHGLV